jgi:hypothetical protein
MHMGFYSNHQPEAIDRLPVDAYYPEPAGEEDWAEYAAWRASQEPDEPPPGEEYAEPCGQWFDEEEPDPWLPYDGWVISIKPDEPKPPKAA